MPNRPALRRRTASRFFPVLQPDGDTQRRFIIYQVPSDYMAPTVQAGDLVEVDVRNDGSGRTAAERRGGVYGASSETAEQETITGAR